jgi:regulator of sigma E protease
VSWALAFLGFVALIILHEFGHFAAAKAVGMRVERFSLFFGPLLVKVRRGETEYGIGPIPLGGYVRITGMNPKEDIPPEVVPRAYYNQAVWKRVVVILAGPAVNLVIAFVLLFGIYWSDGAKTTSTVAAGQLTTPAASYLKPGDHIVAVDGHRRPSADQISAAIRSHHCAGAQVAGCRASTPVSITVRRGVGERTFRIYPRYDANPNVRYMRLGFTFGSSPLGPVAAAGQSVSEMWRVTRATVTTFARIFEPQVRKRLNSAVGAFKVTQQEFAFSVVDALWTLSLISLSLAVINLFPFLPLDGGHVFWAVAEKLRGRRISFEVMERAGAVGFVLILFIFAIGLSNDISTLAGSGFHTH